MSIGEGILLGFVLFGFLVFLGISFLHESKIQKHCREFRESVKDSLSGIHKAFDHIDVSLNGIYKETLSSKYVKFFDCEENKNEN